MDTTAANVPKCYLCQSAATLCFTVVDKEKTVRSYVCANCPAPGYYQARQKQFLDDTNPTIHLECGNCKTVWNQGSDKLLMGCSKCYENFKNALIIFLSKKLSPIFQKELSTESLYPGRKPGETTTTSPMIKLIALNEALKDTLEREDYEQAALLRDQINQIKNQDSHE
ncbi:UvrB/UvrC motif-containing protein [Chlamydiifrater phoenicopteri]|uniref:UvrB/UvrC motif-containing protein n=1 Tax=Chlamydiifrater phoenicopteri TaxID=2681469 RepID=UPI001BCF49D2|nr:UvrB/UvrC motif-containing protein [Chlamydiifrater phoenicopteri]